MLGYEIYGLIEDETYQKKLMVSEDAAVNTKSEILITIRVNGKLIFQCTTEI